MPFPVPREVGPVKVCQGLEGQRRLEVEGGGGSGRQVWGAEDGAFVGEADETGVEGGVPEG